ncbi:unnamed protein product [Orchesella dallaii]|uniref:G-protein coupled receptors family 1 profile domain-containing protein n=1 Tax=Orchesella dallaii TaxID=48710 RepID=A0ABP1S8A2_9HEXA
MSWKYYRIVNSMWLYWWYIPFGLWLTEASRATSTWIVVSFAVERYIAVYHHLQRQIYCTEKRAMYACCIVILCCFSFTGIFSYDWRVAIGSTDGTPINETLLTQNESFTIPQTEKYLGPLQDNQVTKTVIAVSMTYIICQLPSSLLNIYTLGYKPPSGSIEESILLELRSIFNFMGGVNSTCNFLLYIGLNKDYRKHFRDMFPRRRETIVDTSTPSTTRVRYSVGSRLSGPSRAVVERCNIRGGRR